MQNLVGSNNYLEPGTCTCKLICLAVEKRNCTAAPSVLDLGAELLSTDNSSCKEGNRAYG